MFNKEQLELQLEIAMIYALELEEEEFLGYIENFWNWEFKKGSGDYDIQ